MSQTETSPKGQKELCMKQKIKKELKQLADEKYKEFHKGLCPGTENIKNSLLKDCFSILKSQISKWN